MQIFVLILTTNEKRKLEVGPSDTIENVKQKIKEMEAIAIDNQILMFRGKKTENNETLQDLSVENADVMQLLVKRTSIEEKAATEEEGTVRFGLYPGQMEQKLKPVDTEEMNPIKIKGSVFVSYSRKNKAWVKKLFDSLEVGSKMKGMEFNGRDQNLIWVDWEDIPASDDWQDVIYKAVEMKDNIIFVVSPDSIKNEACNLEVDHAIKYGKRIIPVVCHDVDSKEVRKELTSLNWIHFRQDGDDWNQKMKLLDNWLDHDIKYVKYHTKAVQWERNDHKKVFLLQKKEDLKKAHNWHDSYNNAKVQKEPRLTTLHIAYIEASDEYARFNCCVIC